MTSKKIPTALLLLLTFILSFGSTNSFAEGSLSPTNQFANGNYAVEGSVKQVEAQVA